MEDARDAVEAPPHAVSVFDMQATKYPPECTLQQSRGAPLHLLYGKHAV